MPTTQVTYETISTRIYDTEESHRTNNNNVAERLQSLDDFGRRGFTLLSTVTVPTCDGTLIIDTLAHATEAG